MRPLTCTALGAVGVALFVPAALAQDLFGVAFRDPSFSGPTSLYSVNPNTGLASNPVALPTDAVSGIARRADGTWFGWTDEFAVFNGVPVDGALFTFDPASGASNLIGNVSPFNSGALASEGDIDFGPDDQLYGVTSNGGTTLLFTIDPATAANTEIGIVQLPNSDFSGLSFDNQGNLWGLDTSFDFDPATRSSQLVRLDPTNGDVLQTVPLSVALGTVAGMDFNPVTGELFIADGDFAGTNNLYTADLSTGVLTSVGSLGLDGAPTGFGGLADIEFVPAPGAAGLLALAGLAATRRRRA